MVKKRQIRWTKAQREILTYLRQGFRVNDIVAKGYGRSNIERVNAEFKVGHVPPPIPGDMTNSIPIEPDSTGTVLVKPTDAENEVGTKVRVRTVNPVNVGGFFIDPVDIHINQYGGFMIMNTHSYAKEKYGYTGTVGEFLCDACQVVREIMGLEMMSDNYLEQEGDENDNGTKASEGERLLEQVEAGESDSDEES